MRDFVRIYQGMYRVIVGSTYMRDLLQSHGLPGEKLVVSPTFLLEPDPRPLPSHRTAEVPTVLFSGRLVREKGLHHLLRALGDISAPWRLVVAGAGVDESRCKQLAESYGIASRVTFCGWVAKAELQQLIAVSDVVAVTSLLAEAFGRVGPEAFAYGKPVVAYASGGIPDWLHDNVNGLLVPTADIAALRQALYRLLTDPALRQKLGEQAYKRVVADYPIDKYLHAIISILQNARKTTASESA